MVIIVLTRSLTEYQNRRLFSQRSQGLCWIWELTAEKRDIYCVNVINRFQKSTKDNKTALPNSGPVTCLDDARLPGEFVSLDVLYVCVLAERHTILAEQRMALTAFL